MPVASFILTQFSLSRFKFTIRVIIRNGQNDVYLCGRQTHGLVELLVANVKILEFLTKLSVIG